MIDYKKYLSIVLWFFLFGRVFGEEYEVTIQTLSTGTDGIIRIQFFGILGESNFVNAGDANYFSSPSISKKVIVQTQEKVDSLLKIALTVINGHAAHIGQVTVVEILSKRTIMFDFQSFLSEGNQIQKDSPSPDLSNPSIILAPQNASQKSVTKLEGSVLELIADVKVNVSRSGVPTYRWFKKSLVNSPIPEQVSRNQELKFAYVKSTDSARYFCVISLGESVVKTEELNLIVNYLWIQPLQVIITGGSFIQEGNSVEFTCSGSSNLPNVQAIWSKGENILQRNQFSLRYRFEKITRNNSGIYTCQVEVNGETRRHDYLVDVIYLDTPRFEASNVVNNTVFATSNKTAELSCHSEGNPTVRNYTILEDGNQIQTYGENKNKFMTKKGVRYYTCIVMNKYLEKKTIIKVNTTDFKATTNTVVGTDGDGFWTTEMIVVVSVGIAFFILLVVLVVCAACYCARSSKRKEKASAYIESGADITEENPDNIFYQAENFTNDSFMDESLNPNQKNDEPLKNALSASSEEYVSSNNDLTSMSRASKSTGIANGKEKAETSNLEMIIRKDKKSRRDNKKHKTRKHKKYHAEEGEASTWSQVNDSKAVLNINKTVEYY